MSIESVVSWANKLKKNLWWRHAIRLAAEKGELRTNDLQLLFTVAKMEHGLEAQNESYPSYIAPLDLTGFGEEGQAVTLKSIGKVNHVSALVSDALLEFSTSGLTAVYGDNGSGKSSYSKILKNACLTRGETPNILSNIYSDVKGNPEAEISIIIDEDLHEITWAKGNAAREDLKSIRIFDNTSAAHYISGEDTIEYKPAGTKLLSQLIRACEYVRKENERDKEPYNTSQPIPPYMPGGKVAAFLSTLSSTTKPESVDALCLTQEEIQSIEAHQAELIKLKTQTPEQIRKSYADQRKTMQPLLDHFNKLKAKLDQTRFDAIKKSYDDYKTKQNAAELARAQAVDGHAIAGICSPEWKEMWTHIRTFVQTHNAKHVFPPTTGEPCPTCLQPISEEAAEKLKSFNDYLKDRTQVEADKAKGSFDAYIQNLKLLRFDLQPYELSLNMIRDYKPEYANKITELNKKLETLCTNLVKTEPDFTQLEIEFSPIEWINGQIESWKKNEAAVATDDGLTQKVKQLIDLIRELEERKSFTAIKQNVIKEIDRKGMVILFDNVSKSCQTTSVTGQVTNIAKSGAIGNLEAAFSSELKKLGFQNFAVGTKTRGSQGKQLLKLNLTGKTNGISDVASEGEQKCVALAGFMAELTVDDRKSAIIFDDPINSLDHKWRRLFADRIAQEALARQVIVFTHDMAFLKMLEESTGIAKAELNVISIRKLGDIAGYPLQEPPWDAKNTGARVGELKNLAPKLKKMEASGDFSYEMNVKHGYGLMRETYERLVEEWLLRKVVERFGRAVKTQSLKEIVDDVTSEDNDIINAAMSKCSTYMCGHDNATGLAVDCPRASEFEKDVNDLDAYFKALKQRRK